IDLQSVMRHLGVVTRPERPTAAWTFAGRTKIPVKRRSKNLPADFHFSTLRVDFDSTDHAVEFLFVILWISDATFRQRNRETRRAKDVFAVLGNEGRPVITDRVRNRSEDLMSLEVMQIDARDPVIGVVVYEEPAAIVFRRGLRQRRMMHVAPAEIT